MNQEPFEVVSSERFEGTVPESCVLLLFGATGDIAQSEVLPALWQLKVAKRLPESFDIVGIGRSEVSDEDLRNRTLEAVRSASEPEGTAELNAFLSRLSYLRVEDIGKLNQGADSRNLLIYLAIPPDGYRGTVSRIKESGLAERKGWRRLIVEKPFGRDEPSARTLNASVLALFEEKDIYRIDHYLGKEAVQNMLVFRFANPAFESIWNRNFIDHVQIIVDEKIGCGERGTFYERTGVGRDMLQNHLLQLLCVAALEPIPRFDAPSVHREMLKVLECIPPLKSEHSVWGQYQSGSIDGEEVCGYREEPGVDADSLTPTFVATQLSIDNWRWAGVPFYLRTGKRLNGKLAQVSVRFKPVPHLPVGNAGPFLANNLIFRIQPQEGIHYDFVAKRPGLDLCLSSVRMNFRAAAAFGECESPSPYQSLLFDALRGDRTLFPSAPWVFRAWEIVDPLIQEYESGRARDLIPYDAGGSGPVEADALIAGEGRGWLLPPQ